MSYSSDQFFFYKEMKRICAEASDLGLKPGAAFEQIYEDACDDGIVIQSAKTGQEATFYCNRAVKEEGNDIAFWEFLPTSETLKQNPELAEWKVIIYND